MAKMCYREGTKQNQWQDKMPGAESEGSQAQASVLSLSRVAQDMFNPHSSSCENICEILSTM